MDDNNPLKQYIMEFDNHLKVQLEKQEKIKFKLSNMSIGGFVEWIISGCVLFLVITRLIKNCWLLFSLIESFGILQLTLYLYRIIFIRFRIILYIHYFVHLILVGFCIWTFVVSFKKLYIKPFYSFIIVTILMLIKFIFNSIILIL